MAKIVGKKIGKKIEEVFDIEKKLKSSDKVVIKISEIKQKIPEYSSGNGHSCLRDGSRGGKDIGYLNHKYNLKKFHKNLSNKNSRLETLEFREKRQ